MKRATETEPTMKKNIATAIAAINGFLAIGTCGALECDTISLGSAFVRCLVFSAIVFASLRVVRNEERVEQEEARRAAARAARRAAREQESRPSGRDIHHVAFVRRSTG